MQKKLVLLAVVSFIAINTYAQSAVIDSLTQALDTAKGMARIQIYTQLSAKFKFISDEKEKWYLQEAYNYARETNNKQGIAMITLGIGNIHFYDAEYEAAMDSFKVVEKIGEDLEGKWDKAEEAKTKALLNIGVIYKYWGNCRLGVKYFEKAIRIGEKLDNKWTLLASYINIGTCYRDLQMYSEAIRFQKKGLLLSKSENDTKGIGLSYLNIGIANIYQKDFNSAKLFLDSAYSVFDASGNTRDLGITLYNRAEVEDELGNHQLALQYLEDAERTWVDSALMVNISDSRANNLIALGDYDAAMDEARKAISLATNQGFVQMIKDASLTNAKAYIYQNDPDSAIYFLDLYSSHSDSFYQQKAINSLAAWEVELRVKDKELEILKNRALFENAERKRIRFRNLMLLSILFSVLAIAVGMYIWRSRKTIANQKEDLESNNRLLELSFAQQSFTNERLKTSLQERQNQIDKSQKALEIVSQELDSQESLASKNAVEVKKWKQILMKEEKRLKEYKERFDAEIREKLGVPAEITEGRKRFVVWTGSIPYLKVDDKYFEFLHDGKKIYIRSSIGKIIEELGADRFCQISRSELVNLDKVKKIDKNGRIDFFGEAQHLTVTESYKPDFLEKWKAYLDSRQKN